MLLESPVSIKNLKKKSLFCRAHLSLSPLNGHTDVGPDLMTTLRPYKTSSLSLSSNQFKH